MASGPEQSVQSLFVNEAIKPRKIVKHLAKGVRLEEFETQRFYGIVTDDEYTGIRFSQYNTDDETSRQLLMSWTASTDIKIFLHGVNDYIRLVEEAKELLPPESITIYIAKNYWYGTDEETLVVEYPADIEDVYRETDGRFGEDLEDIQLIRVDHSDDSIWEGNDRLHLLYGHKNLSAKRVHRAHEALFKDTSSYPDLTPSFVTALNFATQEVFGEK